MRSMAGRLHRNISLKAADLNKTLEMDMVGDMTETLDRLEEHMVAITTNDE